MSEYPKVTRIPNSEYNSDKNFGKKFPKFKIPTTGAGFILGIFVWIFAIVAFLFFFYLTLFSQNLSFIISKIFQKNIQTPFFVSLLCVIFFFPITLLVIVGGILWKLIGR